MLGIKRIETLGSGRRHARIAARYRGVDEWERVAIGDEANARNVSLSRGKKSRCFFKLSRKKKKEKKRIGVVW